MRHEPAMKLSLVFLLTAAIILGVFVGGLCCVGGLLLKNANEDISFKDGVEKSLCKDSLYGRIIFSNFPYKFVMAERKKADLLVLGSSRVLQFRDYFFHNVSFYNAGRHMGNLQQGINFLTNLSEQSLPKTIIIGLDMWWFGNKVDIDNFDYHANLSFFEEFFYMRRSIVRAYLSGDFENLQLSLTSAEHNYPSSNLVGAAATQLGEGFRSDGSYCYGQYLSGKKRIDYSFSVTKKSIAKCEGHFEGGAEAKADKLQKLRDLLELVRRRKISAVIVLPPFPHEICMILEASDRHRGMFLDFQAKVAEICKQYDIECFNFTDMATVGASDRDVLDGFHGDERAYALLTRKMATSPVLGRYIDVEAIERAYPASAVPGMR